MNHPVMLTAKDVMMRKLIRLRPEMSIVDAARLLVRKGISGAPVVDANGKLLGFLSELDCLRIVATDDFSAEDFEEKDPVSNFMTKYVYTIPPHMGIFSIAHMFVTHRIRKLPVVDDDILIGQVRRRDVLLGIAKMRRDRVFRTKYGPRADGEPALYLSATDSVPGVIARRLK